MRLQEIEQEARKLSETERSDLVLALLRTLPPADADVTDDEVARRDAALESGSEVPMLHEEFVRRVREQRATNACSIETAPVRIG